MLVGVVVGMRHHEGASDLVRGIPGSGYPAVLEHDPSNQYDRSAVRVLVDGAMVGHVAVRPQAAGLVGNREILAGRQMLMGAGRCAAIICRSSDGGLRVKVSE